MNIKKLSIIFLALLTLILSMGIICAAEDSVDLQTPQTSDNEIVAVEQTDEIQVNSTESTAAPEKTQNTVSDVPKKKIKTKVEADQKAVKYKKSTYFKIKVENKNDDDIAVSHVKLNVKVGKKVFKVTTNSKGIAKINTKTLKKGNHKVVITSLDDRYDISKTSKIFVGKQCASTIKSTSSKKVLKNKDVVGLKYKNDFDEKEVKVVFKKKAKFTKIIKAKFYFKNKKTGKIVVKTEKCEFDDGKWEMPDKDYPNKYTFVKVKLYYISTK